MLTNVGFLLRHRGAVAAPPVDGRHPLRSARGLFASKWWTIGWVGAVVAWMLHVGALSLVALIALQAGVFAASALLVVGAVKLDCFHQREGLLLAAAAGCLFGASDISVKFLTHAGGDGLTSAVISPWAVAALAASVIAFYASARSLQIGPALAVIALMAVATSLIAISGGILVFHDSIGSGGPEIVGRVLAFCMVIAAAAFLPAPTRVRVAGAEPGSTPHKPVHSIA